MLAQPVKLPAPISRRTPSTGRPLRAELAGVVPFALLHYAPRGRIR